MIMWHDQKRNLIVYDAHPTTTQMREGSLARLLEHAQGAVQLNGHYVVMPATLTNLQIARVFGLPVIRPLKDYDYPRGGHIKVPFHAQTETTNFLAVNPRAAVLSDMGTGKTLSALWAADAIMRDQPGTKAVIAAPLSTLQTVWGDAIFQNFLGRRTAVIVHGTPQQRIEKLAQNVDFYIINHDGIKNGARLISKGTRRILELGGFAAALAARQDIRIAIIDEVGAFRAHNTLRSRAAHVVLAKRDFLWVLTGTPIPNGPLDAYGIAKLINNAKGEYFTNFRNRIMIQDRESKFKWIPKRGATEEAYKLMQPAIRFKIEDCQDLPELSVQDLHCELSDEQRRWMRELKREFMLERDKGTITAVNEAALRSKFLQIASGVVYDEKHNEHKVDCRPRLAMLRELIDNSLSKTIIFAPFISTVNMLNGGLTEFTRNVIYGATATKDRIAIIRDFQQERDPRVLVAHPETIAEGQTLTAAATVVWWSPTDKTRLYMQGNKRIHRPGQSRNCTVVNIAGCKTEREVYRRHVNNESMQGALFKLVEEKF
jgi:SNF2 family DNA or RNA helicase